MFSRRGFLKGTSVLAAGSLGLPHLGRSAEALQGRPGQKPRHIIHLVSDGLSMGTLTCADHLSHLLRGRGLTWLELYKNPASQSGYMDMRSLNSLVTDSSAASCSWGSGTRIINGKVNQMGDGRPLTPLYELFSQASWATGLVTTAEITHATPAGFAACVKDRGMSTTIAAQYLDRGVDVLLGGGAKYFDPKHRFDGRNLRLNFQENGYHCMETLEQLKVAPAHQRWLGTFARSHLPYMLDQKSDPKLQATVPTLAEMTRAALRRLQDSPHFILQVEGGRIDHACHTNDAVAALHEQIAFDEALDVCLAFQKQQPDTLLVITTDHGNGNMALNGSGDAYGQSLWEFQHIRNVKSSFARMLTPLKRRPLNEPEDKEVDAKTQQAKEKAKSKEEKEREKITNKLKEENVATPTEILQIIEAGTGYKLPYEKAEALRPHLANAGKSLYDMRKSDVCALGDTMANYLALAFTGSAHTSDYVPVLALGPGSDRFRGFIKNTDVFYHYLHFGNIDFRNPDEPLIGMSGAQADDVEAISEYLYAKA